MYGNCPYGLGICSSRLALKTALRCERALSYNPSLSSHPCRNACSAWRRSPRGWQRAHRGKLALPSSLWKRLRGSPRRRRAANAADSREGLQGPCARREPVCAAIPGGWDPPDAASLCPRSLLCNPPAGDAFDSSPQQALAPQSLQALAQCRHRFPRRRCHQGHHGRLPSLPPSPSQFSSDSPLHSHLPSPAVCPAPSPPFPPAAAAPPR
mmetsp:Transcript_71407/g.184131  ORF Transcript_71407/g.184131 Transcript_71407/m.184131 type:complete len:210 (+) Transcript_71407:587-1216(+)